MGNFRKDNGLEFVNDDFKNILTELNIKRELTPVDGAKRNGRVERKLALITEGARAAWLEFPRHFPDLQFPRKALMCDKVWPEAFSWMNDCINISARVDDKPDMLCPWEKSYGRRPTSLVFPFMMPGFRHTNRKTKMNSKGERCFYLNTGNDHSSTTHKVLLALGVASYTADVTFGYHRRPFVGEWPTWGDEAVVSSPSSPQPPQLMEAGGGAGAVEYQRARPQQQQGPSPHSMGAGDGAGAVEYQRARPQQHQRPPNSMGAGGRCRGGGTLASAAAAATAAAALNGSRGRCRGGGTSASAAAAATAAAALNGSRGRCRGGGTSASAAAAETAAAVLNGSRGRCRGGGVSACVAAAATATTTVDGSRGRCRGSGVSASAAAAATAAAAVFNGSRGRGRAEEIQQQWQSPQQELEPSVLTDGAAAATSATDRGIPAAGRPTGDGTIPGGGSGVGTVAATSTRRQQDHLVVRSSSPGPLQQQRYRVTPAVTRSRSREQPPGVSRTFTLLSAEEDIARTLAQPDAVFCDSEELPAGPAHLLETPETYAQAHAGPHDRIWAKAERKEVEGLSAVGTFVEEGGT